MSSCDVSVCPVGRRDEEEEKISIDFCSQRLKKNNYFVLFFTFYYFLEENILFNYNLHVIFFLVPNCPFYYVGAKLSWCQIVRCQIVRFYYVGAKLSWCQIVRCQIVLVPNCSGAKLSGAKLSGAKMSYHRA